MNAQGDPNYQQHYQQASSSQLRNMIQPYAYEQAPYYFQPNDRYMPAPGYNGQQMYIQSVNNLRGAIRGFSNQEQYQNPAYQVYNQQQIPLSYINNYPVSQSSQQHLPPKLKVQVKQCNQVLVNSQYSQAQLLQPLQNQIYQNQEIQSKITPTTNVQSHYSQQSQQDSYSSQKVCLNEYQTNCQEQLVNQQPKNKIPFKSSIFYTDQHPPQAFDIMGHGNLPSVNFSLEDSECA